MHVHVKTDLDLFLFEHFLERPLFNDSGMLASSQPTQASGLFQIREGSGRRLGCTAESLTCSCSEVTERRFCESC